jgi:hypothetical protein
MLVFNPHCSFLGLMNYRITCTSVLAGHLAVSMEAQGGHKCQRSVYGLSVMYVHGGFGVISWSGQAAALWAIVTVTRLELTSPQ